MSLTYGAGTILFALKILPFEHGLLLWSPSHKPRYGHFADNVRENVSGYELGLIVFFLKITMLAFIVVSSSTKFCHGPTIVFLSSNPTFYQIYHHLELQLKFFFIW